jgi:hypothetical protein
MMVLFVGMIFGLLTILTLTLIDFFNCHLCTSFDFLVPRIVLNRYVINERLLSVLPGH